MSFKCENVPYTQWKLRSACASAQSHQSVAATSGLGLYCLFRSVRLFHLDVSENGWTEWQTVKILISRLFMQKSIRRKCHFIVSKCNESLKTAYVRWILWYAALKKAKKKKKAKNPPKQNNNNNNNNNNNHNNNNKTNKKQQQQKKQQTNKTKTNKQKNKKKKLFVFFFFSHQIKL